MELGLQKVDWGERGRKFKYKMW